MRVQELQGQYGEGRLGQAAVRTAAACIGSLQPALTWPLTAGQPHKESPTMDQVSHTRDCRAGWAQQPAQRSAGLQESHCASAHTSSNVTDCRRSTTALLVKQIQWLQELQGQDGEGRLGQTAGGADLHSLVLGHHLVDFFLNLTLCQQLIVEENPLGPQHPPVYQVANPKP